MKRFKYDLFITFFVVMKSLTLIECSRVGGGLLLSFSGDGGGEPLVRYA